MKDTFSYFYSIFAHIFFHCHFFPHDGFKRLIRLIDSANSFTFWFQYRRVFAIFRTLFLIGLIFSHNLRIYRNRSCSWHYLDFFLWKNNISVNFEFFVSILFHSLTLWSINGWWTQPRSAIIELQRDENFFTSLILFLFQCNSLFII